MVLQDQFSSLFLVDHVLSHRSLESSSTLLAVVYDGVQPSEAIFLLSRKWRRIQLEFSIRFTHLSKTRAFSFSVNLSSTGAPCGLRGCKNGPAPFPGLMSYKATKPGLVFVLYLSTFFIVFVFIRAPFMYC